MFQKLRNLIPTKVSEWGKQALDSQREKLKKLSPKHHMIIEHGVLLGVEVAVVFGTKNLSIN